MRINAERAPFQSAEDPPLTADTHFAAGYLAETQGNLAVAEQQYRQSLQLDAKHRPSLYRLGVLLTDAKRYPLAIDTWRRYLAATGGAAASWSNLGYCQELAGQWKEAEAAYRQGIARDAGNVPCQANYGMMLARQGRIQEAMEHLQAVMTPAQTHYDLGLVHEQLGRKDLAESEYAKAVQLDPSFGQAKDRLAVLGR